MEEYETYLNLKDVKIHYEVYSSSLDKVIIMLHGNGGSTRSFDKQIPIFAQLYKVVCIDTRGHGKSTLGKEKLNFDILADDVIAVMNELNINSANIIGFSDGGNTAINLALRYKSRINSLVLSGANLYPEGVVDYIKPPIYALYYITKPLRFFSKKMKTKNELLSLLVKHPHIHPEDLKSIKIPTLVMAGERDLIKKEHTDLITTNIKTSIQYIVENSDHFIADEQPEEFNSIVINFLDEIVYKKEEDTNEEKN